MRKYPRTPHLAGSRRQAGDEDLASVPFAALSGRHLVVEEKVDGANAGISFDARGELRLQSRGHFLTGGPRERHFALFKAWATSHREGLRAALGDRYVLYGEWLYAKHTVAYDALPHYLLEFDILDTATGTFLGTPERRALRVGLPIVPVAVLHAGPLPTIEALRALIGPSAYKTADWRAALAARCAGLGLDAARVRAETDPSDHSRFLYFRTPGRDPAYPAHDDTRCTATILAGLPGAGKDRWLRDHRPELPVVSLDALRADLGVAPTDRQGAVIARARELAREHLRAGRDFAWNATNLGRALRDLSIGLCADYRADRDRLRRGAGGDPAAAEPRAPRRRARGGDRAPARPLGGARPDRGAPRHRRGARIGGGNGAAPAGFPAGAASRSLIGGVSPSSRVPSGRPRSSGRGPRGG